MLKKNSAFFLIVSALIFSAGFFSCASSSANYETAESFFSAGDYSSCVRLVQKTSGLKNKIDVQLDLAILQHYQKNFADSAETFNQAEKNIEAAYTKSISKTAAAASLNENFSEYAGNVYEYILLNAFNALNYCNLGEPDEALVEIRRIEIKQKEYVAKYGEIALSDDETDFSSVEEFSKKISVDFSSLNKKLPQKPTEDDLYKDSAFAHYLAALLYLQDKSGSPELHAKEYYALNKNFSCASLDDDLNLADGMGRLDFVSLAGKIAEREEAAVYIPDFSANGTPLFLTSVRVDGVTIPAFRLKFVYPYLPQDSSGNILKPKGSAASAKVTLSDGRTENLKMVEWLDDAVKKDVTLKARKAFTRSIIRSTTKKAAAVTSAEVLLSAASENFRGLAEVAAVKLLDAVDSAETADVRQCRYFPGVILGGGFTLEPGNYSGKIEYFDSGGNLLETDFFENAKVNSGKPTILESVCVK